MPNNIIRQDYGTVGTDVQTQMLIAPVLATMVSDRAYAVGEQFIVDSVLYKITQAVSSAGVDLVVDSNCEVSNSISQQLNTKKQLVTRAIEEITAADGYITFPTNRCVISAVISYNQTYCPLLFSPISGSVDRAYIFIDRSTTGYPIKAVSSGTTYTVVYKYIPNNF